MECDVAVVGLGVGGQEVALRLTEVGRAAWLAGPTRAEPDWNALAGRVRQVAEGWDDDRAVSRLRSAGVRLCRARAIRGAVRRLA